MTLLYWLQNHLISLKTEGDKLDIDKSVSNPVDLCKLSVIAKSDVVKKTMYDKLVAKVNNIDTSGCVLKTKYDTDKHSSNPHRGDWPYQKSQGRWWQNY